MVMDVEQSDLQAGVLSAPTVVTAILEECSAITDYRTLRDTLPRRLASVLRCRSVLLYQRVGNTLQFASGTFDDKPGWSAALLAVAHINPIELNSNLPEAAAWRERHAVTAPANTPFSMLVAVPLIYRQKGVGVLVAIRTKERDSGELEVLQRAGQDSSSHGGSPAQRQPALPPYWNAGEVQLLEAVAGIVALLLENTRLLERDRERIHELALLNSISNQMSGALYEWERMQSIIIQRTREIAAADLCAVLRPSSPLRESFSWLSSCLQEKLFHYFNSNTAPLIIERPGDESTRAYLDDVPTTIKTFFAFPLLGSRTGRGNAGLSSRAASFWARESEGSGEKVLGIVVGAYHRPWKLRREELVMLQVLANQASAALENTQLMAEVMEARNEARKLLRQVLDDQRLKELILQSIPSGLITVNLEGQITTFNQAAQTILGYDASEALGLPLQSLFALDAVRKVLSGGQEYHRTVEATGRGGQELMLDMHIMPLRDDRNIQIGALLTFTDVTAMHRLEEEKRRLDRLASLGEMAASVAHEVRNPLASIKTSMQMLMDDLTCGEAAAGEQQAFSMAMSLEAQESIAVVLKEVERLDSIVRDLLLFARPRQLHLVPCNLAALSDHVLDLMQGQCADAGVEVRRLYSGIPPLRVDIAQMEQVLFNLFTNSIQAMHDGGILTVASRSISREGGERGGQWLEFSVSDTGPGIGPDQCERIFRPFYTTRAHGIGLGLSITRRLIEDHRGTIRVESRPGCGATFIFLLPVENREEDGE
jgi:PAS domain S-box-containing protein